LILLQGGATKKSAIFSLPEGRANSGKLLRCLSLTYLMVRIAPRALNLARIHSAKLILFGFHAPKATFPIKLYGEAGELIAQSYATAQSEWMTTDFVPFEASLEFTIDKEQAGVLVLEKDNPSGLPEHSDEIRVPVILK